MKLAKACVRTWTWLYTHGLTEDARIARRNEIESDMWEFEADLAARHPLVCSLHLLVRCVLGVPDDLGWRLEQVSLTGALARRNVALIGRIMGAAVFIVAVWLIDADSARRRTTSIASQSGGFAQHIEGDGNMHARRALVRSLPVLMAGIAATIAPQIAAQSPPTDTAFEVASIRPNTSGYMGMSLEPQPGGRLTGTNVTAAMLVRFAYDLPDFLIFGGPNWLSSDRFDVAAKADGDVSLGQKRLMLRRLLAERFKLSAHTDTRELALYALVTARNDRRLGPQLRRTKADCTSVESVLGAIGPSPAGGPPGCGYFGFSPDTKFSEGRGGLAFRGLTMAALAKVFVPILRRSIRDSTGLDGYFDGDFDFIAEVPLPPPPPGMPNPFDAPFGSVFTVFPQQLGLRLESTRGRVDVLVIDGAERPAPE
jgi:uncharacterized protein (TIGR03435 family)